MVRAFVFQHEFPSPQTDSNQGPFLTKLVGLTYFVETLGFVVDYKLVNRHFLEVFVFQPTWPSFKRNIPPMVPQMAIFSLGKRILFSHQTGRWKNQKSTQR